MLGLGVSGLWGFRCTGVDFVKFGLRFLGWRWREMGDNGISMGFDLGLRCWIWRMVVVVVVGFESGGGERRLCWIKVRPWYHVIWERRKVYRVLTNPNTLKPLLHMEHLITRLNITNVGDKDNIYSKLYSDNFFRILKNLKSAICPNWKVKALRPFFSFLVSILVGILLQYS